MFAHTNLSFILMQHLSLIDILAPDIMQLFRMCQNIKQNIFFFKIITNGALCETIGMQSVNL
jgi:hypothetical protein